MSKKSSAKTKKLAMQTIVNRRARFDYELGDEIVAGLSLTGLEVRAAREGHVQLKGAYVTIRGGGWLAVCADWCRQFAHLVGRARSAAAKNWRC